MRGKRKGRSRQCGKSVAESGERLPFFQMIGVMARAQLGEAGKSVGDAFDRSEPRGACANRGQERRENRGSDFVAPIAEEAGDADADDSAVQPVFGTILRSRSAGSHAR